MKFFIRLWLIFGPGILCAQTLEFRGKTYQIYPYRMEDPADMSENGFRELDVPYYPGRLQDGDYAVLFMRSRDLLIKKELQKQVALFDQLPAAVFSIRNGKKEGPVIFYSKYFTGRNEQRIMARGEFLNGKKSGTWLGVNYEGIKVKVTDSFQMTFQEGILHGPSRHWEEGRMQFAGEYRNGLRQGLWKEGADQFTFDSGFRHGPAHEMRGELSFKTEYVKGKPGMFLEFYNDKMQPVARIRVRDTTVFSSGAYKDSGSLYTNSSFGVYYSNSQALSLPLYVRNFLGMLNNNRGYHFDEEIRFSSYSPYSLNILNDLLSRSSYTVEFPDASGTIVLQMYMLGGNYRLSNMEFETLRIREKKRRRTVDVSRALLAAYELPGRKHKTESTWHSVRGLGRHDSLGGIWELRNSGVESNYTGLMALKGFSRETFRENTVDLDGRYMEFERTSSDFIYSGIPVPEVFVSDSQVYGSGSFRVVERKYEVKVLGGTVSLPVQIQSEFDGVPPRDPAMELRGRPTLEVIDSNTRIYRHYENANNNGHRVEFLLGDSLWENRYVNTALVSDRSRIQDAFKGLVDLLPWVYYMGKPYNGDLEFVKGKKNEVRLEQKIHKYSGGFQDTQLTLKISGFLEYDVAVKGHFRDGLAEGAFESESNSEDIYANYNNGRLSGQKMSRTYQDNYRLHNYDKGVPNGPQQEFQSSGTHGAHILTHEHWVSRGRMEGSVSDIFNSETARFSLIKDTVQGRFMSYYNTSVQDSVNFRDNLPHGVYRGYFPVHEQNEQGLPRLDAVFERGGISGKVVSYFHDGGISAEVSLDSWVGMFDVIKDEDGDVRIRNNRFELRKMFQLYDSYDGGESGYFIEINPGRQVDFWNRGFLLSFDASWPGYYKYFFKGGVPSMEGRIRNRQRSGWWKFYTEGGLKYKEVLYDSSRGYKGRARGYDEKGRLAYEGYILDEDFSASCATEANLSFEDLQYTAIYDTLGNNILRAGVAIPVSERQITGARRFDGWWRDGKRDSVWYFYSGNGFLQSAGRYVNGVKEGRWISGDLAGVNALDHTCFTDRDNWKVEQLLKELEFTESEYRNGVEVARVQSNVQTDGFAKYSYSFKYFRKKDTNVKSRRTRGMRKIHHMDF